MTNCYDYFLKKVEDELKEICVEFSTDGDSELREMFYYAVMSGRKYRPALILTGKLIGDSDFNDKTVQLAVAIELIHKYSLILDDFVDGDTLRRGKETFYHRYGKENAIAMSSYFMNLILKQLNSIRRIYSSFTSVESILQLYEEVLSDMSVGFISDLNKKSRDIRGIRKISNMQTSTLLRDSLLLGFISSDYYASNDSAFLYKKLCELGNDIGTVFQAYNDLEVFYGTKFQMANKGKLFPDFLDNRKNILMSKIPFYIVNRRDTNELIEYINRNRLFEEVFNEILDVLKNIELVLNQLPKEKEGTKFLLNFLTEKKKVIKSFATINILDYNDVESIGVI